MLAGGRASRRRSPGGGAVIRVGRARGPRRSGSSRLLPDPLRPPSRGSRTTPTRRASVSRGGVSRGCTHKELGSAHRRARAGALGSDQGPRTRAAATESRRTRRLTAAVDAPNAVTAGRRSCSSGCSSTVSPRRTGRVRSRPSATSPSSGSPAPSGPTWWRGGGRSGWSTRRHRPVLPKRPTSFTASRLSQDPVFGHPQDRACQNTVGMPEFIQNREVVRVDDRDQVAREMRPRPVCVVVSAARDHGRQLARAVRDGERLVDALPTHGREGFDLGFTLVHGSVPGGVGRGRVGKATPPTIPGPLPCRSRPQRRSGRHRIPNSAVDKFAAQHPAYYS